MKTELENIGAWGRMHYDFLYRSNRTVTNVMRLKGTLNDYIMGIDMPRLPRLMRLSTAGRSFPPLSTGQC